MGNFFVARVLMSSFRTGHLLLFVVTLLLGIGVVMVHSANMQIDAGATAEAWQVMGEEPPAETLGGVLPTRSLWSMFADRITVFGLVAVGMMLLCSRLDVRSIFSRSQRWIPIWLYSLSCVLCVLTKVPGVGVERNGAVRWINLGIQFQPSELLKWAMLVMLAWWCSRRYGAAMGRLREGLLPALLLVVFSCGLILLQRDLGTAALLGVAGVSVIYLAGMRGWHLLVMIVTGGAALAAAIVMEPFRMKRVMAFIDPWQDMQDTGFHPIQSMVTFARGGMEGRGLGGSIQKLGKLPEDQTDFIFSIIAEELGFLGSVVVIGLFVMVLWAGMRVALNCRDAFGRILAFGITLTLVTQATINMFVVTVMMPTKGIALPFISSGGTGWILTAMAVGVLAALDHDNHLREAEGDLTRQGGGDLVRPILPRPRPEVQVPSAADVDVPEKEL